ncbi:bacterioferritin [bacterium]|nr:bacterioferritin [bacterium]
MDRAKSIEMLRQCVSDELQAIHQYMYWHFHLDDQGFMPLAALFRRIAIEEMRHLEMIAERVLFLKGDVEMVPSGPVEKLLEPAAIVQRAAEMEQLAADAYNGYAIECANNRDSASKSMFEALVVDEEGHFDEFDKQLDNIKRFGPNYLALQSFNQGAGEGAPAE